MARRPIRNSLVPLVLVLVLLGVTLGAPAPATGQVPRGGTGVVQRCGIGNLTSNQVWTQADVMFTARPVTTETVPTSSADDVTATLSRVAVDEVFKGLLAKEVVVSVPGRPCGRSSADAVLGATRQDDGTYSLIGTVTREQAAAFGGTLPPASGTGPVRALVAVDGGPVDLVAVDAEGAPLGYRAGSSPPVLLARCPQGRTVVAFQGSPSDPPSARRLEVIDVETLTTTRRLPWRELATPAAIACADADATSVSAFVPTSSEEPVPDPGGLVLEGDGEIVVPPSTSLPPGAGLGTGGAGGGGGAGGRILRFQGQGQSQAPSSIAVPQAVVVGVDHEGRFLFWGDATATTLVTTDPASGAPARSVALGTALRGEYVAISDDGRRAVVLARALDGSAARPGDGATFTPVVIDLASDVAPQALAPVLVGVPDRLGLVGDDVVVTGAPAPGADITTTVIAPDGTVKRATTRSATDARERLVVAPGIPAGPTGLNAVTARDLRLSRGADGPTPELFGVAVGTAVFVPATPAITIDAAAAKPAIVATQRLNDGRPLEIDRTPEDRVAIGVAALTVGLLVFMFGGLWRFRAPRVARP